MTNEYSTGKRGGAIYSGRGNSFGSEFYTVVKDYLNILTDSEINKLERLKEKYLDVVEISKRNVKDLDYSTWKDEISNKLSLFTKNLNDTLLREIETDLSSGGFIFLINEMKKLKSECEKYKTEETKIISLRFSNPEDREKYNNANYPLSAIGQSELSKHKKAMETQKNNLKTYENNIKSIVTSIKNISFKGEYTESVAVEIAATTTTSIPSGWTRLDNGFLITSGFMFIDNYGRQESRRILLDPTTGNRVIETPEGLMLYKLADDRIFLEWYINDENLTIDSDIAINLLSNKFENIESSLFEISKRAYGEHGELTPGRHANNFESWLSRYSVELDGKSIEILSFPGDPMVSFLASEGFTIKNLKGEAEIEFISEEESFEITKIEQD